MTALGVVKERRPGESRVAATPDTVRRFISLGLQALVERGAGDGASILDADYEAAGASLVSADEALRADLLLKVRAPLPEEAALIRSGAVVIGLLDPHQEREALEAVAARGASAFAMEFVPRITRAQAMDALSSQANLAGYRAVIEAAELYGRAMPMMMTAAGSIAPAKVFVMGAGVAGLQAIATARRLGAVVTATDVRPAAKEQVESLGARFIAVENEEFRAAETAAGYAKPMSEAYQLEQAALISEHIRKQDIVITTALIPGRAAPRLVSAAQVLSMRAGAVLIDLAVERGGNVEGSRPDELVEAAGVRIAGFTNLPSHIAADASSLYARNLHALAALLIGPTGELSEDFTDEILAGALVAKAGSIVHPALQPKGD